MSRTLTRRGFVAAASATTAVVAASLPALAASADPDVELLALREPFDRTWRAYDAALDEHSAAETEASRVRDLPEDDERRIAADERHAAADALVDSTCDANREVVDEMCGLPAQTIEGLAFKARVSLKYEENLNAELVTSVMDDILAMGGFHA